MEKEIIEEIIKLMENSPDEFVFVSFKIYNPPFIKHKIKNIYVWCIDDDSCRAKIGSIEDPIEIRYCMNEDQLRRSKEAVLKIKKILCKNNLESVLNKIKN